MLPASLIVWHLWLSLSDFAQTWHPGHSFLFVFADKAGFGNNFTTGGDKSLAQSMETVVVGCMFKSLITRCASTTHELHSSENLVRVLQLTHELPKLWS